MQTIITWFFQKVEVVFDLNQSHLWSVLLFSGRERRVKMTAENKEWALRDRGGNEIGKVVLLKQRENGSVRLQFSMDWDKVPDAPDNGFGGIPDSVFAIKAAINTIINSCKAHVLYTVIKAADPAMRWTLTQAGFKRSGVHTHKEGQVIVLELAW